MPFGKERKFTMIFCISIIMKVTYFSNYRVPYIALSRTFEIIEDTSSRLKMIETLANFFRSVIVLSKDDLLPCIYLCLNQLAPAYEGNLSQSLVS